MSKSKKKTKFNVGDRVYHVSYYGMVVRKVDDDGWIDCDCGDGSDLYFHSDYAAHCLPHAAASKVKLFKWSPAKAKKKARVKK